MRIISGEAKGRRIEVPSGAGVRPTTDRTREAVFNMLFSLGEAEAGVEGNRAGEGRSSAGGEGNIAGKLVADIFSGSGAFGLEALSRGAAHVTFYENSQACLKTLRKNISSLGFEGRAEVVAKDVMTLDAIAPGESVSGVGGKYHLAFADPPYEFDRWNELLRKLRCQRLIAESDRKIEIAEIDLQILWKTAKFKKYGTTFITIANYIGAPDRKP